MINKLLLILIVFVILTIIPTSYAQLSFGGEAYQKSIEVIIDKSNIIHVKHVVGSSNNQVNVEAFEGIVEDSIKVTNENGIETQFGRIGNDIDGVTAISLFPSTQDKIIEYDLENVIKLEKNLFNVDINYQKTFSIILPEKTSLIFVNNSPINLKDNKGISVTGGGTVNLQFYKDYPKSIQKVNWEENKFDIEIITDSKIKEFNFEQKSKSISFEVDEENKFVTLNFSKELLWGPYVVLLDNEKIAFSIFNEKQNNVLLSIKPESTGQITIIGTTVIPEFSMFIPLIMGFMIIATVPLMRKFSLR